MLRAAVAEVEDYVRVDVVSESRDLVAGNAVNDVIHLVAELVENATVFSPPNTRIEVRADRAGAGLVAEIEDRGLGLTQEELADINTRLANPPEFDLANSEQLGLFVVSRLAARHSIKVSLCPSVYGGTTANLLLPFGVIVREEEAGMFDGLGGYSLEGTTPPDPVTGRHRLLAAATGRRTDSDEARSDEEERPPALPALPRPPREYGQDEPPARDAETGSSWFDAFNPPPGRRRPDEPGEDAPAAAPEVRRDHEETGFASSGSHLGMPVRVPQASLAPQLRAQPGSRQAAESQGQESQGFESTGPDTGSRSPEATRSLLFLMQQGWERGRVDNLDDPAGISDNETER